MDVSCAGKILPYPIDKSSKTWLNNLKFKEERMLNGVCISSNKTARRIRPDSTRLSHMKAARGE